MLVQPSSCGVACQGCKTPLCSELLREEMEPGHCRGGPVSVRSDAFCYPESCLEILEGGEGWKKIRENKDYLNILVTEICFK